MVRKSLVQSSVWSSCGAVGRQATRSRQWHHAHLCEGRDESMEKDLGLGRRNTFSISTHQVPETRRHKRQVWNGSLRFRSLWGTERRSLAAGWHRRLSRSEHGNCL